MELVNTIRKTIDTGPGAGDPAVREAIEAVTVLLSMFAPHTAEDMWERLGYQGSVSAAPLRKPDATLLVEESVTSIFQVDGKVRDKAEVPPTIGAAELEALARESAGVVRAVGDREIANVIVRAPRVVNIATVASPTKG
jgi:leucyl-tRNA synthetase